MGSDLHRYLVYGGIALAVWFLITRPMTQEEARRSSNIRAFKNLVSIAVAGACFWFAWWVMSTNPGARL